MEAEHPVMVEPERQVEETSKQVVEEKTREPETAKLQQEEKRPVVLYKGTSPKDVAQLQCPIHKGLMHDPVGTGKCKHVFCRSCLASWVELQGHCPLDSKPAAVDQLVPAEAAVDKLNSLLIHCRWGLIQDPDTGAWSAANCEGYCPALITIGDRVAHEDSCAYRPVQQGSGSAVQLMPKLPNVNVDHVMQTLKANLSRFERVLAERMDLLLAQVRSLLEEQHLHRLRSGASGAMTNFKEEIEAVIAGFMTKQGVVLRSLAEKSEVLCSEARDAARAKGSALFDGAVHVRNQAAVAGGEALSKLENLTQEIMAEVKLTLMRSLEPKSCPTPPPPPPPDCVIDDENREEEEQEEQKEQEPDTESAVEVGSPISMNMDDADWDDSPAWIPAQPALRMPPRYPPPPPPPRSSKPKH